MSVHVLLVEDEDADAELVERELRGAHPDIMLRRVETKEEFVRELRESRPDIIISDHRLPRFGGWAARE